MKITTVTYANPALAPGRTTRTLIDRKSAEDGVAVVGVSRPAPGVAEAAGPIKALATGHFGALVAAGGKAKLADQGVTFLLEQVNSASPAQVSAFLLRNHLASTPAAATSHAETLLGAVQGKEGGAVLLGIRAGVGTFVVVDSLKPEWSLARKIALSLAAAAAVVAVLVFGLRDKPEAAPAVVAAPAAHR